MQKRRYSAGYYIEMSAKTQNREPSNSINKPIASLKPIIAHEVNNNIPDYSLAKFNNTPAYVITRNSFNKSTFVSKKVIPHQKEAAPHHLVRAQQNESNHGGGIGILFGIIFILVGWYVFTSYIMILGAMMVLCGIMMIILGIVHLALAARERDNAFRRQNEVKTEQLQKEKEDVVYLKNGSIIRGQVIEMKPNESIKIQTRDGSVFVYSMNEVLKMDKEMPIK